MKNIVITGGAGYVGAVLVPKLLKKNTELPSSTGSLPEQVYNLLRKNSNIKIKKGRKLN